jgi:chromosomal replication initiation ATPase DnaA
VSDQRQLVLDLPARPALGRSAFYVAQPNRLALAHIELWPDWPEGKLALVGPEGSGKTHLAHVWAARASARIMPVTALPDLDLGEVQEGEAIAVEDVSALGRLAKRKAAAEEALFHLHNRLSQSGGTMLVTGEGAPSSWPVALPDLASRLSAIAVAPLQPPDDALLAAVLVKLFDDRQLEVTPELIDYLLPRIERSFAGAQAVVARLDQMALARRRPVTVRLAMELLAMGTDREQGT